MSNITIPNDTSCLMTERDATNTIQFHRHCQATVLSAYGPDGKGATWSTIYGLRDELQNLPPNWINEFTQNSNNITEDLASILKLINKVAISTSCKPTQIIFYGGENTKIGEGTIDVVSGGDVDITLPTKQVTINCDGKDDSSTISVLSTDSTDSTININPFTHISENKSSSGYLILTNINDEYKIPQYRTSLMVDDDGLHAPTPDYEAEDDIVVTAEWVRNFIKPQVREITMGKEQVVVTPETGFTHLSKVIINPDPNPSPEQYNGEVKGLGVYLFESSLGFKLGIAESAVDEPRHGGAYKNCHFTDNGHGIYKSPVSQNMNGLVFGSKASNEIYQNCLFDFPPYIGTSTVPIKFIISENDSNILEFYKDINGHYVGIKAGETLENTVFRSESSNIACKCQKGEDEKNYIWVDVSADYFQK